jgi:hypothetical protein
MSINLVHLLKYKGTPEFDARLKQELIGLGLDDLPLQQGLSNSSVALDDELSVVILDTRDYHSKLTINVALFYTGIITGCHCADDPTPQNVLQEHCEIQIDIDKDNGNASIRLLPQGGASAQTRETLS